MIDLKRKYLAYLFRLGLPAHSHCLLVLVRIERINSKANLLQMVAYFFVVFELGQLILISADYDDGRAWRSLLYIREQVMDFVKSLVL